MDVHPPMVLIPIGSMYTIYGNIYHQYTPNVSIYTIHGSYGIGIDPYPTPRSEPAKLCVFTLQERIGHGPIVARSTRPRKKDLWVSCGLVDIAMKRRYLAMICNEYVINMKYYEFIRSQL
jgi:hypothetical protein